MTTAAVDYGELEAHRRSLTGYCYRMLGSAPEAEDAVQETLLKAWKGADRFEGRSSLRTWVYRIATNVCLDMQRGAAGRVRPMDLGPAAPPREEHLGPWLEEVRWLTPAPDDRILAASADPAEVAEARETVRLAFVAALQRLPARQRAALILCEVLKWSAAEAAELLDASVASVNSALQRARASLTQEEAGAGGPVDPGVLERYVEAFTAYDMDRLVALLKEDAVMSMPPYGLWLQGAGDIVEWMVQPGPLACAGSRLVPLAANGGSAFAQYRPDPVEGWKLWGLQVLEGRAGRISGLHCFLDTAPLCPIFGVPMTLPPAGRP